MLITGSLTGAGNKRRQITALLDRFVAQRSTLQLFAAHFLIHDLKIEDKAPDDPLLPAFTDWRLGMQAIILRGFCQANSLPSIKFHTLRACFATQLIASGIPATVVMKICGWKDMKTMQRYVRLAGIDESGATERLSFIPTMRR